MDTLTVKTISAAIANFRKPYSCAQTVYAAFAPDTDAQTMDFMKQNSGGRAPEGMCGALFAATQLAPERAEELAKKFAERVGDTACLRIKREHKTPCEECVRAAAELLSE